MSDQATARKFLLANASFSILTGITCLSAAAPIAGLLMYASPDWMPLVLRLMGLGLLSFALIVGSIALHPRLSRFWTMQIVQADLGWIVGTAVLTWLYAESFTTLGLWVLWSVAALVMIFALGQYRGAKGIKPATTDVTFAIDEGTLVASTRRKVKAPQNVVWQIINDHPAYADVADNISKVEVIEGDAIGMQRRCYGPHGENWTETCDLYEEGRLYGFTVHTEADSYPYPFETVQGRWSVNGEGTDSEFLIEIFVKAKGNAFARAMFNKLAPSKFSGLLERLGDRWADRMEKAI
ncbi:MAG: SRPBCC family protein [Cognatishimia sp.]|uniref:SRPBCC family protein n=1 Tax=Cognatishimia sp. TaxID=2211648 RepID=UPI003B8E1629